MVFTAKLATAAAAAGWAVHAAIGAAIGRRQPPPFDGRALQVSFPARDGGARIDGWYLAGPAPDGQPAVVVVPGKDTGRGAAGHAPTFGGTWILAAAGCAVLVIDRRGEGSGSRARMTAGERERFDVLGAVDWLHERGHRRIGVLGASMGAATALLVGVAMRHRHLLTRTV
jgi:dipeptidyl aminopeptidase/acylaminoacyl peptidase